MRLYPFPLQGRGEGGGGGDGVGPGGEGRGGGGGDELLLEIKDFLMGAAPEVQNHTDTKTEKASSITNHT
jgi:hypothetical protein